MRKKVLSLLTGACLLPAANAYATASPKYSDTDLQTAIQRLMQQTEELQREVKSLKSELNQVKHTNKKKQKLAANQSTGDISTASKSQSHLTTLSDTKEPLQETPADKTEVEKEIFISHLIGSPVLTSPLLSLQSSDDASDLLVNYSTINEDLTLLQDKKKLTDAIGAENMPSATRPLLILSGKVESQFTYQNPYGNVASQDNLALSGIELDAYAMVGKWASGFISIAFNSNNLDPLLTGSGDPANNGNLYVNRGFLTIGDLTTSPIYLTTGQTYLPFGRYSTYMLSNPSTKVLGRTNVPTVILGYADDNLSIQGYIFDGATNVGDSQSGVDAGGANILYKFSKPQYNGSFGTGIISNIADSQGAQSTGGSGFIGFSQNSTTENIARQVPAVDFNASLGTGPFNVALEYITTTREYAASDLTYNGSGAAPKAFHGELDYIFDIYGKPSSFALSYDQTWQALALALPKNSYTATFNTSIWKNTIQTLEFRHDVNYPSSDTAGGLCSPNFNGVASFCYVPSVGSTQNTVLAQIGVYF